MRPINKRLVTLEQGAAGEVRILFRQWFDLPGSAECKVTRHYLIGAAAPPRRRGIGPLSTFFPNSLTAPFTDSYKEKSCVLQSRER